MVQDHVVYTMKKAGTYQYLISWSVGRLIYATIATFLSYSKRSQADHKPEDVGGVPPFSKQDPPNKVDHHQGTCCHPFPLSRLTSRQGRVTSSLFSDRMDPAGVSGDAHLACQVQVHPGTIRPRRAFRNMKGVPPYASEYCNSRPRIYSGSGAESSVIMNQR